MLEGISTLYHESTYANDKEDGAQKYFHSTARQAATVARDAHVGKLLLGHFSARYTDETILLNEAKEVFENAYLTAEMKVFDV
jgi:ribonuclease Z